MQLTKGNSLATLFLLCFGSAAALSTKTAECAKQKLKACLQKLGQLPGKVDTCYTNAMNECKNLVGTLATEVKACAPEDQCVTGAVDTNKKIVEGCLTVASAKKECQSQLGALPTTVSDCLTQASKQSASVFAEVQKCFGNLQKLSEGVEACFNTALETCKTNVAKLSTDVEACFPAVETEGVTGEGQPLNADWINVVSVSLVTFRPLW